MDTLAAQTHHEWLLARSGIVLHFVPSMLEAGAFERLRDSFGDQSVPAICGRSIYARIPGALSRIGAERCRHCCAVLGIPAGHGTPLNESAE